MSKAGLVSKGDPTDLFAFKISYNEVENDLGGIITPLFNGNIAETFWKTDSDNIKRNYGYQYDALNRLTNSIYQKDNLPTNSYNEVIWYDPNGNITNLYRTGYQDGTDQNIPFEIDDLVYGYATNSNKLLSVYDQSLKLDGFKDGNPNGIDFEYDPNGNMIKDRNKQIHSIKYNHLNLPTNITFENGSLINYIYNAVGVKLAKIVGTVIAPQELNQYEVHYVGGFQYRNDTPLGEALQFFPTAEGYVSVIEGQKFNYVFNYTDHLGNIRVSYTYDQNDQQLKILEENHYYPFGLKHSNYNTDKARYKTGQDGISVVITPTERSEYQYKYNGKEFQDELGLNMYDYGARNYDAALGRWMNIDPLAETSRRFSPFTYALNNPVFFIDPDGMEARANDWIPGTDGERISYDPKKGFSENTSAGTKSLLQPLIDNGGEDAQLVLDMIKDPDMILIAISESNDSGTYGNWDQNSSTLTINVGEIKKDVKQIASVLNNGGPKEIKETICNPDNPAGPTSVEQRTLQIGIVNANRIEDGRINSGAATRDIAASVIGHEYGHKLQHSSGTFKGGCESETGPEVIETRILQNIYNRKNK